MTVRAQCGIAIYSDYLRLYATWSGISYTHEGQQTILHCFVFKNYRTDCQVNLKDLLDKFEIYWKSLAVRHLSPSLDQSFLIDE